MTIRQEELADVVRLGIAPVLEPAGFEWRKRRGATFVRSRGDIYHLVSAVPRHGIVDVFWGVLDEAAVWPLYGVAPRPDDFSACVLQGTAKTVSVDAQASWFDLEDPKRPSAAELAPRLENDMRIILAFLAQFRHRGDVLRYLLEERDAGIDPRRQVILPLQRPLRLLHAAALAVAGNASMACELLDDASDCFGEDDERIMRLRGLAPCDREGGGPAN